ncbi:tyrosine-type recombinase/integrase [Paenibacillus sp. ACRRX]|uniref:tyrosine-type recombinase/integrase n=1 Tax=unclassified Paenibacillus TaxID=185978 RepID=UPI001EF40A1E|nr:tyrosine-type recombinase/integrase [Paenibacillus sp. UMB4589-SE434]MCG7408796.1 tyrosine-type recombinase/integrase [Paenibacillus sp. ACRRX]MDK8183566.1 tyrosine-type recombinase/integrase [Paenibacillus sp. UMB4589-SE434]
MEFVNPIRDVKTIQAMKEELRKHSVRDLLLFVLGINTGISLLDLLNLTVQDVWDGEHAKQFLYIKDEKTGEEKDYYLNNKVGEILSEYLSNADWKFEDYLFKSKKDSRPITRQQAYRIINHSAREVGISEKIGTHTLRKTFGYHAYYRGVSISILKSILHHHSTAETLKYLGIDRTEKRTIKVDVNL